MRWLVALVPAVGIVLAMAVPLLLHVAKQRDEQVAVDVLRQVHAVQQAFRAHGAGYAINIDSLTTPCPGSNGALSAGSLSQLASVGYALQLRMADAATLTGRDCHGRPVASDYYMAVAPLSAAAAQEAYAGRSDGHVYLFFDGVPPREADMDDGLAVVLSERESFKIP